jgi:hypothetical protein
MFASSVQVIFLFVCFCSSAIAAPSTLLYQFDLADVTSNANYAEGSIEYHCLDVDDFSNIVYIRGTYGNFGYFEGANMASDNSGVDFLVNWYEAATGSNEATSGSAFLSYDSTSIQSVSGPYWNSGSSDMLDSRGAWSSINGVFVTDDSTESGASTILEKCLYPGVVRAKARDDIVQLRNPSSISAASGQGSNDLCEIPAGVPKGSWLGTYQYVYGDDDGGGIELGDYGVRPIAFWGESGMGFVGTWHAATGGYAGSYGTNLYMTVSQEDLPVTVGFYCTVDASTQERTDCFSEYYEVSGRNDNEGNCPYNYRMEGELDPLFTFASKGSALKTQENEQNNAHTTYVLSVFFGMLSAVLLMAVIFLLLKEPSSSSSSSWSSGARHTPVPSNNV